MIDKDNICFRKSTKGDYFSVNMLLRECFGDRERYGALEELEDRYLLAFDGNKLVAMTGLCLKSPTFNGSEIDWTCVLPSYRGRGIITSMISELIKDVHNDIYSSCLRLHNNDEINLKYAMRSLGFECIEKEYRKYNLDYADACNYCVYRLAGKCICCEDLYIRRATNF